MMFIFTEVSRGRGVRGLVRDFKVVFGRFWNFRGCVEVEIGYICFFGVFFF